MVRFLLTITSVAAGGRRSITREVGVGCFRRFGWEGEVVNVEGESASTNTGGEMQQCWAGPGGPGGGFVLGELAEFADEERRRCLVTGQSGGWPPKGVARDLRPILPYCK